MSTELKFLTQSDVDEIASQEARNAGELEIPTRTRTYSRWLEDKKRRERWIETCVRTVEYNIGLYQGPASHDQLRQEARLMLSKMYNREVLPAGRSMFIGGTKAAHKWPEANFNCTYLDIRELEDFCEVFSMLLCGCGVGFGIRQEEIASLPRLRTDLHIEHAPYNPVAPDMRAEDTTCSTDIIAGTAIICVGDSKEAWVESLRCYLALMSTNPTDTGNLRTIIFNYDSVRPKKERLKTFGGRAAGPAGLEEMFRKLHKSVVANGGIVDSVLAMDLCNFIASNVVVGGTRRSAQIAIGSPDDKQFIDAKLNLWPNKTRRADGSWDFGAPNPSIEQRQMSNNSVAYTTKPTRDQIKDIFKNIEYNGDPGFFNLEAALKRRPNVRGLNPCAEILLDDNGVCNLSTVVITSHIRDGVLDMESLVESFRLACRIGMRQTNVTLNLPQWDAIQKRDRLTGVSMTGFMDALDVVGKKYDDTDVIEMLKSWRAAANDQADVYAQEMSIPRPLLVTAVKPEGTISLLPTVSCGMHRGYAPYFLRRISIAEMDPVAEALIKMGVPYEGDQTKEKSGRLKFVFPVKTNAAMPAAQEPARDQLMRYLIFQKHYTDHNTSCTITIGPDEWDEMADLVHEHWDDIVACAFLSKMEDNAPQLPYQRVDEETYLYWKSISPDSLKNLEKWVDHFEGGTEYIDNDLDLDVQCSTGACPPR